MFSMPFLSMMRRPLPDTRSVTKRPSDSSQNRLLCRFGRKRRLVLLLAGDTLLPVMGRLPVTWQTLDMVQSSVRNLCPCGIPARPARAERPHFIPEQALAGKCAAGFFLAAAP